MATLKTKLVIAAAVALSIEGVEFAQGAVLGVVDPEGERNSEHCPRGRVIPRVKGVTFGHLDARLRNGLAVIEERTPAARPKANDGKPPKGDAGDAKDDGKGTEPGDDGKGGDDQQTE